MSTSKTQNTWITYGVAAVVALTLYATGLHTEALGFLQRGVLMTGLHNANPNTSAAAQPATRIPADFNMTLMDAQGNTVSLAAFKGKVIFINFWATWCPPCVAEMPGINRLYEDVKADGIVFLMISLDEDYEKAKRFREAKEFSFDVYRPTGNIPQMYQGASIPATYIIGANGELMFTQTGMADYRTPEFKQFVLGLRQP